jgi:3-dehydroquinate dehydratase I
MAERMQGKICVSIAAPTVEEAVAIGKRAEALADVLEIRVDSLTDPDILPFVKGLGKPLLFTNRPTWEGGNYPGDENERIALLLAAIDAGAAYVDIELQAEPGLQGRILGRAREQGTQVIVSWHDFKTTPSAQALATILQRQYRSGAAIGKIVTTARDFRDVLRVLSLQEAAAEMDFPLIAFCMGRPGMISRLATLALHGYMSYAAPDDGPASAAGQLPLSALRAMSENFL